MLTYQSRRKNQRGRATAQQKSEVASHQTPLPVDTLSAGYRSTDPTVASPALEDHSADHLRSALNQRLTERFGSHMPHRRPAPTPESPSLTEMGVKTGSPDTEPLGGAKRPRSMNRFGADFENPRAEAEADKIGKQFSNFSSFDSLKTKMGEKLGADFSGVRLHHDTHSAEMAQGANAKAFTTGKDIYMGAGGFNASVAAHEMVHTMQQGEVSSTTTTVMDAPAGSVQYVKVKETERNIWLKKAGHQDRSRSANLPVSEKDGINADSPTRENNEKDNVQDIQPGKPISPEASQPETPKDSKGGESADISRLSEEEAIALQRRLAEGNNTPSQNTDAEDYHAAMAKGNGARILPAILAAIAGAGGREEENDKAASEQSKKRRRKNPPQ